MSTKSFPNTERGKDPGKVHMEVIWESRGRHFWLQDALCQAQRVLISLTKSLSMTTTCVLPQEKPWRTLSLTPFAIVSTMRSGLVRLLILHSEVTFTWKESCTIHYLRAYAKHTWQDARWEQLPLHELLKKPPSSFSCWMEGKWGAWVWVTSTAQFLKFEKKPTL